VICRAVLFCRDNAEIYAVNTIKFHPVHGTFATAGGDGTYNFWDKDSKQRLRVGAVGAISLAWDSKDGQ
jgi:WD40 repeat protein